MKIHPGHPRALAPYLDEYDDPVWVFLISAYQAKFGERLREAVTKGYEPGNLAVAVVEAEAVYSVLMIYPTAQRDEAEKRIQEYFDQHA